MHLRKVDRLFNLGRLFPYIKFLFFIQTQRAISKTHQHKPYFAYISPKNHRGVIKRLILSAPTQQVSQIDRFPLERGGDAHVA